MDDAVRVADQQRKDAVDARIDAEKSRFIPGFIWRPACAGAEPRP